MCCCGLVVCVLQIIDDMLFAIGGFNGVTTIFNVECYDINADEW
jgi:kelch-like protein 10